MLRRLLLAVLLLLPGAGIACLNDSISVRHEHQFRSAYASEVLPSPANGVESRLADMLLNSLFILVGTAGSVAGVVIALRWKP